MASIPKTTAACAMVVALVSFAGFYAEASIGLNWGRISAQRLVPSQVVDLLLQNGIRRARVFSGQGDILAAFARSGINLTVSVASPLKIQSKEMAKSWIDKRSPYLIPSNVKSVLYTEYCFHLGSMNKDYITSALKALHWMQEALNERGWGHIKANFIHFEGQMKLNAMRPSECEFLDEIKLEMVEFLEFLRANDAPFLVEQTPLMDVNHINMSTEFAYPDNTGPVIEDVGGRVYSNMVEWRYDCYLWALKKLNASDLRVHFSMMAWPTDGYPGATAANAERFFKHLLPWVTGNKGTPMRPGVPIDVNIHSLTDENKVKSSPFARHYGIYRSNGSPKYKIDLSGQGRDIYPTTMKGIMRMPKRWCVFNGNRENLDTVMDELGFACNMSDCTSTSHGGSCSHLSFEKKVSYAFNMYFQSQFQNETACIFSGLGHIVAENPSTKECVFPVEVVRGQQVNYGSTAEYNALSGAQRSRPSFAVFLILLSIVAVGEVLSLLV